MRIARFGLCLVAFVVAGSIAIVVARPVLLKHSAITRAESDFRKLVSEGGTEVYISYPELLDRIVADNDFSQTITKVHLVGPNGINSNFTSLKFLSQLTEVEVTYGHGVDRMISTLNSITELTTAKFYYCGQPDLILRKINNSKLTSIAIHSFQPPNDGDRLVESIRERLPRCTVTLTND